MLWSEHVAFVGEQAGLDVDGPASYLALRLKLVAAELGQGTADQPIVNEAYGGLGTSVLLAGLVAWSQQVLGYGQTVLPLKASSGLS